MYIYKTLYEIAKLMNIEIYIFNKMCGSIREIVAEIFSNNFVLTPKKVNLGNI